MSLQQTLSTKSSSNFRLNSPSFLTWQLNLGVVTNKMDALSNLFVT